MEVSIVLFCVWPFVCWTWWLICIRLNYAVEKQTSVSVINFYVISMLLRDNKISVFCILCYRRIKIFVFCLMFDVCDCLPVLPRVHKNVGKMMTMIMII